MARSQALLVATFVSGGCQSFVGDYTPDLTVEAPVDVSRLCAIERDEFAFPIDLDSDVELEKPDLVDFYAEQNLEFITHINRVIETFEEGTIEARITYLSGAAGVGKSFLLGGLQFTTGEEFSEALCTVDLDDLFVDQVGDLEFEVRDLPDLATIDGEIVFNDLPTLSQPGDFTIEALLESAECYVDDELVPFVLIDGVDEVHDETARLILETLDKYVIDYQGEERFVHFLVAGRPEGFASWLTDPDRDSSSNRYLDRFDLEPPRYDTPQELEYRAFSYLDFIGIWDELEADGELGDYLARFEEAVVRYPFLTYSLGNLAYGNFVVEHTGPGEEDSEEELKVGIFDDILLRDAGSHDRPGTESRYNVAYRRALEEVAVRYVDEVNNSGVFTVSSEDKVSVPDDDGGELGEVRVRTLLNRSGVAFLTTRASTTRYHFDPFWVQAHLIQRYNQRHFPGYRYRGCP